MTEMIGGRRMLPHPERTQECVKHLLDLGFAVFPPHEIQTVDVSYVIGHREVQTAVNMGSVSRLKDSVRSMLAARMGGELVRTNLLRYSEDLSALGTRVIGVVHARRMP